MSPLGAGALAGSSLPIDPVGNAADLGFAGVFDNSLDAVSDRDFVAEAVFDLALVGTAGALVAAVADLASAPTAGLGAALNSSDGALRSRAAIALGKMSFGILQSFMNRMEAFGYIKDLPEISRIYRHFMAQDESYELNEIEIKEEERPPMVTIDAYRKRFRIAD